jgi:hypothetical protein
MEVNQDSSTVHSANLSYADKDVRLFSDGSSLAKLKTARFDTSNSTHIALSYVSKVPVGCDRLIGEWEIVHEGEYPGVSRIVLSFGFNTKSVVELSKSVLFTKDGDGEITQTPLDVKIKSKPMKLSKIDRLAHHELLKQFNLNDMRLAKIAEARNTLESLIFELKDAIAHDPVWLKVTSATEKIELNQTVGNASTWVETHHEFEDETELKDKTRELEDAVKGIKYRVHESRSRESSIHELEYLLADIQDAVLNRWPAKKLRVPKQQKKAMLNHVKLTREWLDRKTEEQAELEPWDEPLLKTADLELRIAKLGEAFKVLEDGALNNKLKNRRDDEHEDEYGADL